jgi:hypothetical protein
MTITTEFVRTAAEYVAGTAAVVGLGLLGWTALQKLERADLSFHPRRDNREDNGSRSVQALRHNL